MSKETVLRTPVIISMAFENNRGERAKRLGILKDALRSLSGVKMPLIVLQLAWDVEGKGSGMEGMNDESMFVCSVRECVGDERMKGDGEEEEQ